MASGDGVSSRHDVVVIGAPTYTYGYKFAAIDTLARLDPGILRGMRLPSRAHRV
jgi:hypothetical protein